MERLTEDPTLNQRRWVARYYNVPLTDPRLNDYTEEMLMIEMAFLRKEKPEWFNGESYSDPNYAEWERKALAEDQKIVMSEKERAEKIVSAPMGEKPLDLDDTEEWEHVEIDDADPPIET